MLRTTLIALRGYRGKKVDNKHETPLSEVSYNLIPAPVMVKIMFFVYIFVCFKFENIGNNVPFPLLIIIIIIRYQWADPRQR